jgi:alpha 1,6-mannosyltransferase
VLASKAALSVRERQLSFSNIPLLMHQTGASSKVDTWKPAIIPWVQQWLGYAVAPNNTAPMAYFFWDDEGIDLFMERYEKDFINDFYNIFTPVERADIFRVLVCQHFGGVVCPLINILLTSLPRLTP